MAPLTAPVEQLYDRSPKLRSGYIEQVLGLAGETAERVAQITGGISREEAMFLDRVVRQVQPLVTLEVGLGYGFSALVICEAASRSAIGRKHIVIDPHQTSHWHRDGLAHLAAAGHGDYVDFHEAPSCEVLPELVRRKEQLDFAFVDGWHTFDYVFVDAFFIDKLLRPEGVVVFDDSDWPSVRPVLRFFVTNLSYSIFATMSQKTTPDARDLQLGLQGSCIALQKPATPEKRDIFFHRDF